MIGFQLLLLHQFLPRAVDPARPRLSRAILIAYLLPATALMWAVLPGAVLRPSYDSWWAAIQAMMVPMPAPFLWFMSQVFRAEERPIDRRGVLWPLLLSAAVIGNETLMGYAFAALAGAPGLADPGTAFSLAVNSPWFAGSMIVTMVGLLLWIPSNGWKRATLGALAASALAGPLWLLDPLTCAVVMSIVMASIAGAITFGLVRDRSAGATGVRLAYGAGAALAAMALAGLVSSGVPSLGASGLPFAVVGFVVMVGETAYLLHAGLTSVPDPAPAPLRSPGPHPTLS